MAKNDFDLNGLARYLHLPAGKVMRMADRGKVPGRKVGGEWRFSSSEIHHWLEHRIRAVDEQGLLHLEGALERFAGPADTAVSIEAYLPLEAVSVPLPARTKASVISSMIAAAERTGWLWDPNQMAEAVRRREEMFPTAMDNGVALLHPRRPQAKILEQPILAMGRTQQGIPFGSASGALTDLFFLICSVDDSGHLRTLARLGRLLGEPQFVSQLRATEDATAARELIVERERALLG